MTTAEKFKENERKWREMLGEVHTTSIYQAFLRWQARIRKIYGLDVQVFELDQVMMTWKVRYGNQLDIEGNLCPEQLLVMDAAFEQYARLFGCELEKVEGGLAGPVTQDGNKEP